MLNENLERKRWLIVIAAIAAEMCVGTTYAWSVFKKPLMFAHGWSETSTQITFMLVMGCIGVAGAFGGMLVDKKGPKFVATIGGILFGIGTLIAGIADRTGNILLIYLGYGLITGIGGGFCYVTPLATLIRWFPDKRGLVTGLAIMGFGSGSFFMGLIAPKIIINIGVANTFYVFGIIFSGILITMAQLYKNPPEGWVPSGFKQTLSEASGADSFTFDEAIKSRGWWTLWGVLFLNVSAGFGLVSQISPLAQDVIRHTNPEITIEALAIAGGKIMAIVMVFNTFGRLMWAWISDAIGRKNTFIIMLLSQVVLYILLPRVENIVLFTIIAGYLLTCLGGSFAIMPAFTADSFGSKYIGRIYGMMLTAGACAGILGPFIFAHAKGIALYVVATLLVMGFALVLSYKKPLRLMDRLPG